MTVGRRFDNNWSVDVGVQVQVVQVSDLEYDYQVPGDLTSWGVIAPPDVQDVEGNNLLTSVKFGVGYDSTDSRFRPSEGYKLRADWEQVAGDADYAAVKGSASVFRTVHMDLAERKTIWAGYVRGGCLVGDAPVF